MLDHPLELFYSYTKQNLDYKTITEYLKSTFKGIYDPFGVNKLLELKNIEKKPNENWTIFASKLRALISATSSQNATEEDKEYRLWDHLLSKMDKPIASEATKMLKIRNKYTIKDLLDALETIDAVPNDCFYKFARGVEHVNLGLQNTKPDQGRQCLFCGDTTHYMADCRAYESSLRRNTALQTNIGSQEPASRSRPRSRDNYYSRPRERSRDAYFQNQEGEFRGNFRGRSPYRRNRDYSPYYEESYSGRYYNDYDRYYPRAYSQERNRNNYSYPEGLSDRELYEQRYRGSSPYGPYYNNQNQQGHGGYNHNRTNARSGYSSERYQNPSSQRQGNRPVQRPNASLN